MPEIDLRGSPWNIGIPSDPMFISRELYYLLAIYSASKPLSDRRKNEDDESSVYGYGIRNFELTEVGRLLVSLSALCRNVWDYSTTSISDQLRLCGEQPSVGVLVPNIENPNETRDLEIRSSWNKILHCHTMNFQRSKGPSVYSGH